MYEDLAPNFMIKVEGTELAPDMLALIEQVEVQQEIGMVDSITMTVANINLKRQYSPPGQPAPTAERISDLKTFAEGNSIEVWAGYGDKLEFLSKGIVMSWLPEFPRMGVPTIKPWALGKGQNMMGPAPPERKTKQWRNMTYDAIVKEICGAYGFDTSQVMPAVVAVPKKGVPLKNDISDWDFVKELANLNAFEFYIYYDPDIGSETVIWGPPKPNQKATFNLMYDNGDDTTLFAFTPEFVLYGQAAIFEVYGWDTVANQPIVFRVEPTEKGKKYKYAGGEGATNEISEQIVNGDAVALANFGQLVKITSSSSITTEDQARNMADKILAQSRDAFLSGRGEVIGIETMKPRQVHNLKGLGNRFDGRYYFKGVKHTINRSTYVTSFSARLISDKVSA